MQNNPYFSKDFIINTMSQEDRVALKASLLGKKVKIIMDPKYGLITEHGFPVAIAMYRKFLNMKHTDFYAKVIEVEPMVTIYEIPEEA